VKQQTIQVSNNPDLNNVDCPLPLSVIPNYMGINLCSVESVTWEKQEDDQLTYLTIKFIPAEVDEKSLSEFRSYFQAQLDDTPPAKLYLDDMTHERKLEYVKLIHSSAGMTTTDKEAEEYIERKTKECNRYNGQRKLSMMVFDLEKQVNSVEMFWESEIGDMCKRYKVINMATDTIPRVVKR
jgi:hypothetical protein